MYIKTTCCCTLTLLWHMKISMALTFYYSGVNNPGFFIYFCSMKTTSKLKTSIKDLKLKTTCLKEKCSAFLRPENLKHYKVVKWYRNSKAWNLHLNRRLEQYKPTPKSVDQNERDCINCGHHYSGRICPQCGQAGTWTHYTWKQIILNFLDIWGMGNRPMFRTLGELFWRPGYMIRDYLNGHRQFYFPPFKLVAVLVVLLLFVGWLTGTHALSPVGLAYEITGFNGADDLEQIKSFIQSQFESSNISISSSLIPIINTISWIVWLISKNMLYEWLFIGAILVICVWIAFIKVNKYNFVETYIFLTYVLALFLICLVPGVLLYRLNQSLDTVIPFLHKCTGIILLIYIPAVCFLLVLVFKQFFGLSWWSTILHLFVTLLVGALLAFLIGGIISSIATNDIESFLKMLKDTVSAILIIQGFSYAAKYYKRNKGQAPRSVIIGSKVVMLNLFRLFAIGNSSGASVFQSILILFWIALYAFASVALSLLPVFVYKKYQRTWLSFLSFVPLIAFIALASRF